MHLGGVDIGHAAARPVVAQQPVEIMAPLVGAVRHAIAAVERHDVLAVGGDQVTRAGAGAFFCAEAVEQGHGRAQRSAGVGGVDLQAVEVARVVQER